jgi:hypothetical protein
MQCSFQKPVILSIMIEKIAELTIVGKIAPTCTGYQKFFPRSGIFLQHNDLQPLTMYGCKKSCRTGTDNKNVSRFQKKKV